jgi:hypothetical protein
MSISRKLPVPGFLMSAAFLTFNKISFPVKKLVGRGEREGRGGGGGIGRVSEREGKEGKEEGWSVRLIFLVSFYHH